MTAVLLLPPNASKFERDLEAASARVGAVETPVGSLWDPRRCPAALLPWLAWAVSVSFWNPAWSEQQKRDTIAQAIDEHRIKGTRAAVRRALDRRDPAIGLTEWQDTRGALPPFHFRVELPISIDTDVVYSEDLIAAIEADIAAVKPARSRSVVMTRLDLPVPAQARMAFTASGIGRFAAPTNEDDDPSWQTYLATDLGEPFELGDGTYLEV